MNPDHSIAAVLADLAALLGPGMKAPTDSAWCQARSRLPEAVLVELIRQEARRCRCRFGRLHQWNGRPVFRIDGSTVSMPDTPSLVRPFGYTRTRHGRSRFPVARVTFAELAGLDVVWNYRMDRYVRDEDSQLHDLWNTLPSGCICLMDRKFCSFYNLAKLRQRNIGVITPLHQRRDWRQLIAKGVPGARRSGSCRWTWLPHCAVSTTIRRCRRSSGFG